MDLLSHFSSEFVVAYCVLGTLIVAVVVSKSDRNLELFRHGRGE